MNLIKAINPDNYNIRRNIRPYIRRIAAHYDVIAGWIHIIFFQDQTDYIRSSLGKVLFSKKKFKIIYGKLQMIISMLAELPDNLVQSVNSVVCGKIAKFGAV